MRKCIIIPEYSDVGAAYNYAAENYETTFLDGDIDTAQGRRDFISLALYYLKDNNVVPSQQSIQIIVDTLSDYDTVVYNGMVSLAANEVELKNVVQQNWDTVSITPDSKNIAPEANDFPMSPIPSIRSGLDTIFDNINDQERFVRIFQNDLTRFSFVNYNSNTLITTPEDLNTSIRMYKNQIFEDLADDLNQPKSSMYIGREFQKTAYDELVKTARVYFHPYTSSGIFISNDIKIINAYNKFLILTNFDRFITKYSKDLIQVARGFIGGHIDPKNGYKYTYNIGKHIKQDYNDVTNDISDHVNNAVQLFINSIPLLDANNKPTGQYVNFKSFQSLTRIFRNIFENKKNVLEETRNNPREVIPTIINIANEFKSTYLRGDDTVLIPTFNSIRHYVFDTKNPSSLASLESKISDFSGMNLYSMILNHINKTSPVSYLQYKYSAETGKYVISYLDSESISQKQTDLEKHLMIQSQYDNYSEIFAKHNITIQQSDDGIAQSISFNIGGADYKYTLMGRKITRNGSPIPRFKATLLGDNKGWSTFLTDILKKPIDTTFLEIATEINDDIDLGGIINVAMATIINADVKAESIKTGGSVLYILSDKYGATTSSHSKTRVYYDKTLKSVRIGGILNSLSGLKALSKTIAANNRDVTKSYVKNMEGNSLPKYRLTTIGNDDMYLFSEIGIDLGTDHNNPMRDNLFLSTNGLLMGTALKTDFTNSDGQSKTVSKMQANELLYTQFVLDYLQTKDRSSAGRQSNELGGVIAIQPTTYSDKSNIWVKLIDVVKEMTYRDRYRNNIINNRGLNTLSVKELNQLRFSTLHGMFSRLKENIIGDYKSLFLATHNILYNGDIDETDYNSLNSDLKPLFEKRIEYVGDDSYTYYDYKKNLTIEDFIPILAKLDEDRIYQAVLFIQQNGSNITILPEVHYSKTKKGLAFNTTLLDNMNSYSLKDNSKKTTVDNISDAYWNKKKIQDKLYAYTLKINDVRFDLVDEYGKEVKTISDALIRSASQKDFTDMLTPKSKEALYNKLKLKGDEEATYGNIWINSRTQRLNNFYILKKNGSKYDIAEDSIDLMTAASNPEYEVYLNPDLDAYKSIDNLISDNYNAATIGLPFLHPAKGATTTNDADITSKLNEEAARTTAFYKRGVVVGATIHPFIKGKITGIPDHYKLAVIEDVDSPVFNIQGDKDKAKQFDGGIFLDPMTARYEQNSLEEIALSPVHRKPLGYFSLSNYMSSGLLKCATFAVTNEYMRTAQSGPILGNSLMKQMSDIVWDIPNLDVTVDRNGREISYNGQIYRDINTMQHWFILDIQKINKLGYTTDGKIDNRYTIKRCKLDKNGNPVMLNRVHYNETITVSIDSNYDLWMALGGEFSMKRDNGSLIYSESSIDKITEVGNLVAFDKNSTQTNPLIIEANKNGAKIRLPRYFSASDVSQNTYYQPMKYSNIHYLATAGAVKNGMANLNPKRLFNDGYNPNVKTLKDTDRIIYGHPAIGKTTALKHRNDFISFDDEYGNAIKEFINGHKTESQTIQDYKRENPEDYQQFLLGLYETAKYKAKQENKRFFFSDKALLQALDNIGRIKEIDAALTLDTEEFVRRDMERGSVDEANSRDWKMNIDMYLRKIANKVINIDRSFLSEILDNTHKSKQRSQLTYIKIKPNFIGIQLNAEHNVDESEVSEMTQVISALEQMSTSHDMANSIYEDIGRVISRGLKEYQFDLNSETDRSRVYKILGRNLLRVFSTGDTDRLGLAGAFMGLVKADILSDKSLSQMQYQIPFDDNNIFGIFTNGFTSGLNRDIIKRKYSGLQAVLTPSRDIVTVYDHPTGGVMKYSDILYNSNTPAERNNLLSSMDRMVEIGEVRTGDWIKFNDNILQVMNYRSTTPGQIGLLDLKDLRLQGYTTVKVLGSKGRNLRSATHVVTLTDGSLSNGVTSFDAFDLDASRLSWELQDKKWKQTMESEPDDSIKTRVWNEVVERIKDKFNKTITLSTDKSEINNYLRDLIAEDLASIQDNKSFRIPVAYRTTDSVFAPISNDRFDANELAIGKNTASKFGLKVGDSFDTIASMGPRFFARRQREILFTDIGEKNYDLYFVKNNRQHLHVMLNNNPESIKEIESLIRDGFLIEDTGVETTVTNGKTYVVTNGELSYRIDDDSKFYNYITANGESRQVLVTSNIKTLKGIEKSKLYSNVIFNYKPNNIATLYPIHIESPFTVMRDKSLLEEWWQMLLESPGEESKQLFAAELNEQVAGNLDSSITNIAQTTYTSWQEALNFIVARIPSQSMQSFMNMKVAMFTESDTNICYVPVEQIWYQGSGYDFDRVFMLGASISDQGIYHNWSPLFNFNSKELLNRSHDLPFPTEYSYFNDPNTGFLLNKDYSVLSGKSLVEIMKDPLLYNELVDLVRETSKLVPSGANNIIKIQGLDENLIELLNEHNQYELGESDYQEAIKNKIFNALWRIGGDIKNVISATSPVSVEPAQDAAELSTSGQFSKLVSNENPGARLVLQYQNSIGKDGIGVYATGLKIFSLLLNYYNEKLKTTTEEELPKYLFHSIKTPSTGIVEVYKNDGTKFLLKESPTLPNVKVDYLTNPTLIDLAEKVYKLGAQEDVFLTISVLLSAATDNAKELILEKINAGPDLASVYIYLLATGIDFKTASDFMTTRAVTMVNNKAKKDILYITGKKNNLKKAVQYYTEMANPDNYIPTMYQQSIIDWGRNALISLSNHPEFGSEVKELLESNEKFFKTINNIKNPKLLDALHDLAYQGSNPLRVFKKDLEKLKYRVELENELDELDDMDNDMDWMQPDDIEVFGRYIDKSADRLKALFSRYVEELHNRQNELQTLSPQDISNMKVVLYLKTKSDELTRLGRFGSLNQGVKTKLIDKIIYIH